MYFCTSVWVSLAIYVLEAMFKDQLHSIYQKMTCMWNLTCSFLLKLDIHFFSKSQMVQGMLAFAIFISHGLACYVAIDIIWNDYMSKKVTQSKMFWEYVTRCLLVFLTCNLSDIKQKNAHFKVLFFFCSFAGHCNSKSRIIYFIIRCSLLIG